MGTEALLDAVLLAAPAVLPVAAALGFEQALAACHGALELVARSNWVQVDGGISRNAASSERRWRILIRSCGWHAGTLPLAAHPALDLPGCRRCCP